MGCRLRDAVVSGNLSFFALIHCLGIISVGSLEARMRDGISQRYLIKHCHARHGRSVLCYVCCYCNCCHCPTYFTSAFLRAILDASCQLFPFLNLSSLLGNPF